VTVTTSEPEPTDATIDWFRLPADEVCQRLGVDPAVGLTDAEVLERRERYGPNKLAEDPKEPAWRAFLRQYNDLMQLVLVGAAVVSIVALQDFTTGLVVFGLTVLNAVMGLNQEGKAAESVASLRKMLVMTANVRRAGERVQVPAEELVPGDIVGFEAGDKVSADGRLLVAATLEIEEAGLTGESTPASKAIAVVTGDDVPLGDRADMAYMNTQVTRGRGEMVVTTTGMGTEMGHISGMLSGVEQEKTPLTKQLDQLTVVITIMAAAALALIVILGLARGDDFDEIFFVGISLAISAIPTGLPAVVTMLLSLGTQQLAEKGAIVKRLRSVETLGSTSAICSDKTGTLTLNQMTARQLIVAARRFDVDGEGYSTTGRILRVAGEGDASLEPHLLPMALANDAVIRDGACIGDPTEGALVVLAAKGGLDVDRTRERYPPAGRGPVRRRVQADGHVPRDGSERPEGRAVLREGRARRAARSLDPGRRRDGCGAGPHRRAPGPRAGGERPARGGGAPCPRRRPARPRPSDVRCQRRPAGAGAGARPPRAGGDRGSAPEGGEGRHRAVQGGGHPCPHDHRRPRDDGGRHRPPARDRGPGPHGGRVRGDAR
jgi:Ca2+-transporting ATPase